MKITPENEIVTGYKATDKDMKCQGFQFKLGEWAVHDGEIELCKSGFHFCPYPSGPWCYYDAKESRLWKIEAKIVHQEYSPGADLKYVCKMIRLVEEMKITGDRNTGNSNTGDCNTGDCNTGNCNTGNWNTGNCNTGNSNTGDRNTGNWNTGDRNTGNSNTGNSNTGDWNLTNFSSGFFCQKEPFVICFDKQTKLTRDKFYEKYPEINELSNLLLQDNPFDYGKFKRLPGYTRSKCKKLHEGFIASRKDKKP
jgi:hypothetical protein